MSTTMKNNKLKHFDSVHEIEMWAWTELRLGERIPGDKERRILGEALVYTLELGKDLKARELGA